MQRALVFVTLFVAAFSQVTLQGGAAATALTGPVAALFGSISVSSSKDATINLGLGVNLGTLGFAGANSGGATFQVASTVTIPTLSIYFTTTAPTTLTITLTTSTLVSTLLNANVQFHLFLQTASVSGTVYGALPVTVNSATSYTYTLNMQNANTQYNIAAAPADVTTCKTSGSTSSGTGSASFNYQSAFFPVALGQSFNLQSGTQYAFGENIQVTPTSGSGSFQANLAGNFAGSASSSSNVNGPSGSNGYFNSYYTFSGSGNTNVLQWKSLAGSVFVYANGTTTSSSAWVAANAKNGISWFKAETGATAANAWTRVQSTSSVDASGQVAVYATTGSYSQWTVGASSGNGAGALSVAGLLIVGATLFSVLF